MAISVVGGEPPPHGLASKRGVEGGLAGEASGVDVHESKALRVLVGVGGGGGGGRRWWRRWGRDGG